MDAALMEREAQVSTSETYSRPLSVPMGTATGTVHVTLPHSLITYLRGAYLERSRSFRRATGKELPIPFEKLLYLDHLHIEGESRDPHTVVIVSGLDNGTLAHGVGFAKRSFDRPRIERGTSIALDRAIDDLIRKLAMGTYAGNGNGA